MNRDDTILKYRVAETYRSLTARAGMLDFTEDELREKIRTAIKETVCPYCLCGLLPENYSVDHNLPTSRKGTHLMSNLDIICRDCNTAKWTLTGAEFKQLCSLLRKLGPDATNSVIGRLKLASNQMLRANMSTNKLATRSKYAKYVKRRPLGA